MNSLAEEPPRLDILAPRKGEGQLLLTQKNESQSVIITGTNAVVDALLGYAPEELLGRKVETVLGTEVAGLLADDLDYTDGAPDFGDLLERIREVRLRRRNGEEFTIAPKLTRVVSLDRNACFQIIIPNERERITASKLREFLALNLEGRAEIDAGTGLPNHTSLRAFLPQLRHYLPAEQTPMACAVIRVDRYKKSLARYGTEGCLAQLKFVAGCCKTAFRSEDMLFQLSDHSLGVILFDISHESARVVFNRLRWKIRNQRFAFGGKADFSVTVSVGFDALRPEAESLKTFEHCEVTMMGLGDDERNALIDLAAV